MAPEEMAQLATAVALGASLAGGVLVAVSALIASRAHRREAVPRRRRRGA
ncbi:hypothetical protein [Microbacterium sp. NPDC055683]